MTWFDDLPDPPEDQEVVVPQPTPRQNPEPMRAQIVRQAEDSLLAQSLEIIEGALDVHKVPLDQEEVPQEWIDELGQKKAKEKFRLLQMWRMSSRDAPVALKAAQAMATSIIKARSAEKTAPRTLNVAVIYTDKAPTEFEAIDVEADEQP